ncbi:hypothetical protein [Arhodomonas aquaeolei]|uniref:hypothetical protein n=1 Tax=Arhodomonas aquaeolei TaxID=2369 RepID=UPI00035DE1D4|nr:hypothetical protein [Arhodomonas aquaeolei]
MNATETRSGARWPIVVLAVMFFGPAILAWVMVINGWRPGSTTNNGVLVDPPVSQGHDGWRMANGRPMPAKWFEGYWTLLVPVAGDCGSDCRAMLDELRRARVALNRDADRVRVLLLQPRGAEPLPARLAYNGLVRASAPRERVTALLEDVPGDTAAGRGVFIIDYLGFRMMAYPVPLDGAGLLDDMERLLKAAEERIEDHLQHSKPEAG